VKDRHLVNTKDSLTVAQLIEKLSQVKDQEQIVRFTTIGLGGPVQSIWLNSQVHTVDLGFFSNNWPEKV
jgi:hypothetical protein